MQKGFVLLDVVVGLIIVSLIIGVLAAGSNAVYNLQRDGIKYYNSIREFREHLESLYEEDWDNLGEYNEGDEDCFKCYYEKKVTKYNTVQLKVTGIINGRVVEVFLEKTAKGNEEIKPVAMISMSPDSNITDETEISWDHSESYDPRGYDIVEVEWDNKKSFYSEGTHIVSLRVKNSLGEWSSWTRKIFNVESSDSYDGKILIHTLNDLINVAEDLTANYVLMNDIDLAGLDWVPIGSKENYPFTGTFNGNGYKILNLTINMPSNNGVGLFGYTDGATIENLALENVNILGKGRVGGLVGESKSSVIINSYVTGMIEGLNNAIGGLVGTSDNSRIENSYAAAEVVKGWNFVGGIAGRTLHSQISNTYSAGEVIGHNHTGGLVGQNVNSKIVNSYYNVDIAGQKDVGKGEPRTTAEMMKRSTYKNWDFVNVWKIKEGKSYPTLKSRAVYQTKS